MINFGALFAFMCVNLSVIVHYYVKGKKRGFGGFIKFLLLPLLGFATCFVLFISLSANAKIAGGIWLLIGIIYLATTTNFFRKTPKILEI